MTHSYVPLIIVRGWGDRYVTRLLGSHGFTEGEIDMMLDSLRRPDVLAIRVRTDLAFASWVEITGPLGFTS